MFFLFLPTENTLKIIFERADVISNSYKVDDNFYVSNIPSDIVLLLNCSHSVKHRRDDSDIYKYSESLIGVLIEDIFTELKSDKVGFVYKTGLIDDDPNYNVLSPYRDYVLNDILNNSKIDYIFDLHICSDSRPFFIEYGTNDLINIKNDLNFLSFLENHFTKSFPNYIFSVDTVFAARHYYNFNTYIIRESPNPNLKSIQMEINFNFFKSIDSYIHLKTHFKNIILDLLSKIEK